MKKGAEAEPARRGVDALGRVTERAWERENWEGQVSLNNRKNLICGPIA